MDPLAHTLFGATLAEAGLKRHSRLATATLLIGANLPDIDVLAYFWGSDFALWFRRGWSHGVLAMLILPLLLAGLMMLWQRWRPPRSQNTPSFNFIAIVLLSYLAVWSHPVLDWLNTYGVRLLMPFDERWFYGDTLFIIDPWFWLLTAAGVVLARSQTRQRIAGWLLLAGLIVVMVFVTDRVDSMIKMIFAVGVAVVVALRLAAFNTIRITLISRACLLILIAYVGFTHSLGRQAERIALSTETDFNTAQANPVPGNPFQHRMILVHDDYYQVITPSGETYRVARQTPDKVVTRAMQDPAIQGFINWMRFPYWQVTAQPDGWLVTFKDLRYVAPDQQTPTGIGLAQSKVRFE